MDKPLLCWKCGADLKDIPRPFSRFASCSECRVELHVCLMCRHFNAKYTSQCDHDMADKVLDKDKSNFCGYFKPSLDAYSDGGDEQKAAAQRELQNLFGEENTEEADQNDTDATDKKEIARNKLNDLFD